MRSSEKIIDHFIQKLIKELPNQTKHVLKDHHLELTYLQHHCSIQFFKEKPELHSSINYYIPIDLLVTKQNKLIAMIQSKLHYTRTVYARNCTIRRIDTTLATNFLNAYHLMNYAKSAFHYGLFDSGELVAVASFSKGRKMNRLKEDQRSFELVRFCCKEGISVSGGLSKLLTFFIEEKQPGDIMTYIDKQFSVGRSYTTCGFKKHSETPVQKFMINKKTFERNYYTNETIDTTEYYLAENCGNIKLIYTIAN